MSSTRPQSYSRKQTMSPLSKLLRKSYLIRCMRNKNWLGELIRFKKKSVCVKRKRGKGSKRRRGKSKRKRKELEGRRKNEREWKRKGNARKRKELGRSRFKGSKKKRKSVRKN